MLFVSFLFELGTQCSFWWKMGLRISSLSLHVRGAPTPRITIKSLLNAMKMFDYFNILRSIVWTALQKEQIYVNRSEEIG